MKIIKKQPSKWSELICVLFGHRWDEYGSSKCQEHNTTYDENNECSRCGLVNYGVFRCCIQCLNFYGIKRGDSEK